MSTGRDPAEKGPIGNAAFANTAGGNAPVGSGPMGAGSSGAGSSGGGSMGATSGGAASVAGLAAGAPAVDQNNPWPGLTSFTEDLSAFFFGRGAETAELFRLVKRQTLTVLFGQSGLGKSSLLQAGLFPQMREADFLPIYIRLDHSAAAIPLAQQVKAAVAKVIEAKIAEAPLPTANETLWEYFQRKDVDFWGAKNHLLKPVLVIDQFEEIFTLGRANDATRARGDAFITELSDLIENRVPESVREALETGVKQNDQFDFELPGCAIVLSLREDYLPELEGLRQRIRSIMQNRMRITRMSGTQAFEVVSKPGERLLEPSVVPQIIKFVAAAGMRGDHSRDAGAKDSAGKDGAGRNVAGTSVGKSPGKGAGSTAQLSEPVVDLSSLEIEPALLSVVCRELNNQRIARALAKITADLLANSAKQILADFYERSISDLPHEVRIFIEDRLLTKSGYRDNVALENALMTPGITLAVLDTLVQRRLLRLEDRVGLVRVELTHDLLAEPILASRNSRKDREAAEEESRRLAQARWKTIGTAAAGVGVLALIVFLSLLVWALMAQSRAKRAQQEANDNLIKAEQQTAIAEAAVKTAEQSQEQARKALLGARDTLGDYFALRIQNEINSVPPRSLVAQLLLMEAPEKSSLAHTDLVNLLIPPAPFRAERILALDDVALQTAYSPDCSVLAVLLKNGGLRLIDTASGKMSSWADPTGAGAKVEAMAFRPSANTADGDPAAGNLLSLRLADDTIVRWDYKLNQEQLPRIRLAAGSTSAAAKAPDPLTGKKGAAVAGDAAPGGSSPRGSADSSNKPAAKWAAGILPIVYSPDGKLLAVAKSDGGFALIRSEPSTGEASPADAVETATTRPADTSALAGDGDKLEKTILNATAASGDTSGSAVAAPPPPPSFTTMAFLRGGAVLVTSNRAGIAFWDCVNTTNNNLQPLTVDSFDNSDYIADPTDSGSNYGVMAGPDGSHLAIWSNTKSNFSAGTLEPEGMGYRFASGKVSDLGSQPASGAYSPDGKWWAAGLQGDSVEIYDIRQDERAQSLPQAGPVTSVACRPDGLGLAAASSDKTLHLWKLVQPVSEDHPWLQWEDGACAVSEDGKSAAVALLVDSNSEVHLHDIASGHLLKTFKIPSGLTVLAIRIRDDGDVIAALKQADQALQLWDLGLQKQLWKADASPSTARFSRDGNTLACADGGVVSLYATETGNRIASDFSVVTEANVAPATRPAATEPVVTELVVTGPAATQADGAGGFTLTAGPQIIGAQIAATQVATTQAAGGVNGADLFDVPAPSKWDSYIDDSLSTASFPMAIDATGQTLAVYVADKKQISFFRLQAGAGSAVGAGSAAIASNAGGAAMSGPAPSGPSTSQPAASWTPHQPGSWPTASAVTAMAFTKDGSALIGTLASRELFVLDMKTGRKILGRTGIGNLEDVSHIAISGNNDVLLYSGQETPGLLQQSTGYSIADLNRESGQTLNDNMDIVPLPMDRQLALLNSIALAPPKPAVAEFWRDYWKVESDRQSLSDRPISDASMALLQKVYNPLIELAAKYPDLDIAALDAGTAQRLRALNPLPLSADDRQIDQRLDEIRDDLPFEKIIMLKDMLDHLAVRSPRRAAVCIALADSYAGMVDTHSSAETQEAKDEKEAETFAAITYVKEALDLGYTDWDSDYSLRPVRDDPRFPIEALSSDQLIARGKADVNVNTIASNADAIRCCDLSLKSDPTLYGVWNTRGVALFQQGKFADAVESYNHTIAIDKGTLNDKALFYTNRANALASEGKDTRQAAYDDLAKAMQLDPKFESSWELRASLYSDDGKLAESISDYSQAITLQPKRLYLYRDRSYVYYRMGDLEHARADLEALSNVDPTDPAGWQMRGDGLTFDEATYSSCLAAIDVYSRAIQLGTDAGNSALTMSGYYERRADAYYTIFQWDKSLADFQQALMQDPKNDYAMAHIGQIEERQGDYQKAIDDLNRALMISNDTVWYFACRARALMLAGQTDLAMADVKTVMAMPPDSWREDMAVDVLLPQGHRDQARQFLQPEVDGGDWESMLLVGKLDRADGKTDEADALFSKIAGAKTATVFGLLDRAEAQALLGHFDPALRDIAAVQSQEPNQSGLPIALAKIYALRAASVAPADRANDELLALYELGDATSRTAVDHLQLKFDLCFDDLRDNPEFITYMAAIAMPMSKPERDYALGRFFAGLSGKFETLPGRDDQRKACADAALAHLEKAVGAGLTNFNAMATSEHDFDSIRSETRFQLLLNPVTPAPQPTPGQTPIP